MEGDRNTMCSDGQEMFAKVEIKEEHCWAETVSSESQEPLDSDYLPRNVALCSSEAVMESKCNVATLDNVEIDIKRKIKTEPYWLETSDKKKSQTQVFTVLLKTEIKDDISSLNEINEDTLSTKSSRPYTEPVCSDVSTNLTTVVLKSEVGIEVTKENLDCETNSMCEVRENYVTEGTDQMGKTNSRQEYKCEICGKCYPLPAFLKTHQKAAHEDSKKFKCETCGRGFKFLSTMKCHLLIHEGIKPHKCQYCEKSFTRLSQLKMHNYTHEGTKPYKCNICGKNFTESSNLKKHILIHEGKKPYKCEICGKSFTQMISLKLHNVSHESSTPDKYDQGHKCEICGKVFTKSYLKIHNLIHEGKRPHKCEICEKTFTYKYHLKRHRATHEGKKPYKCDKCEKHFGWPDDLKRHISTHEGKKPHKCDICGKFFTQKSHVRKHKLLHERLTSQNTKQESFIELSKL